MLCCAKCLYYDVSKVNFKLTCLRDKNNEILCPMWKKFVVIAQKQEKVIWHQNDKSKKKNKLSKSVSS